MARSAATAVTRPQPRRSRPQRERPHPARPQRPRSRPADHGRRAHASRATAAPALPRRLIEAPFARAARARTGGVLDALLAGRGWIVLIGLLLAGIVFFNVDLLQMNRDIAMDTERAAALKRENGRLRLDVAKLASSERIQEAAARLGLVLPAPGEVRYLKARPGLDARRASRRITEPTDLFSVPAPAAAVPPVTAGSTTPGTTTAAPVIDPVTGNQVDPYTGDPIDPAAATPPTIDPVTGNTVDPATGAPIDPATGAPLAAGTPPAAGTQGAAATPQTAPATTGTPTG